MHGICISRGAAVTFFSGVVGSFKIAYVFFPVSVYKKNHSIRPIFGRVIKNTE